MATRAPIPGDSNKVRAVRHLRLGNNLGEIDRMAAELTDFAHAHGFDEHDLLAFNLCLEELVTNIIKYGLPRAHRRDIDLTLAVDGDLASAYLEDDAPPYNPIACPEVDTTLPIEQRSIGGLGVHLVKRMMDSVEYERRDQQNSVVLRKVLRRSAGPARQPKFHLELQKAPAGVLVVRLFGRLDSQTSPAFDRRIHELFTRGERRFLCELSGLDYISSAGLGVLLSAGKRARTLGGHAVFVAPNDAVRHVLELAGFAHLFPQFAKIADAQRWFEKEAC